MQSWIERIQAALALVAGVVALVSAGPASADPVAAAHRLDYPGFSADFGASGVEVAPADEAPLWRWRFESIASTTRDVALAAERDVAPAVGDDGIVRYARGPVVERYVPRERSVEQQFVLPEPLELGGGDLVVRGVVESAGGVARAVSGWTWGTGPGAVTLGDVFVFDAQGQSVPARMEVDATSTRIVVDGAALATAAYPVTIDPEIGTNDFRISQMGTDGDGTIRAMNATVAYDPDDDEYLVVWDSDDTTPNEVEIWAQRVDGTTGALLGARIRVSDMGPDGSTAYQAMEPDVVYNAAAGEYLVVWHGDDDADGTDGKDDIYGQRITASTGVEVGTNDFRISVMGTAGDTAVDAFSPAVAWDSTTNQYLVVWEGDDVDGQFEIHGQRLAGATGLEVGPDDFRISDMGTNDADVLFGAFLPDVAYDPDDQEFLVVWQGDDDTGALVNGEFEIYGQRITAATGAEVGTNDFRISAMGPMDGIAAVGAASPAVAYDTANGEYLVVWDADDLILDEFEIYGQRLLGSTGAEVGTDDFRISDMGPDEDATFMAFEPAVAYSSGDDLFLVTWEGEEANGEMEIYSQAIDGGTGAEIGVNDERLSDMGADGDVQIDGLKPGVACDGGTTGCLVVWEGDDDTGVLVNNEFEIYGQQILPSVPVPALPPVLRLLAAVALVAVARGRPGFGRPRA